VTQHEHGPWRDADENEPSGVVAAVSFLLFGVAVLVALIVVLAVVGA
jgi:hypothetical protein